MSSQFTTENSPVDVLVIGAGPAGIACTLTISRLLYTSIVFTSGVFRNSEAKHMHGIPTWEHQDPADYRAAARKDILDHYDTASFQDVSIKSLEKKEGKDGNMIFKAVDENGTEWWGRRVALASGIQDIMPDIGGYKDCWVKGIFHCLFCHGYEERGSASAGVLAIDDCAPAKLAIHLARFAIRLADKVTIYTNGVDSVTKAIQEELSTAKPGSKTARNISIEGRKIAKLIKGETGGQVEVVLEDGEKKLEGFLAHKPVGKPNGPWVEQLGLETTPQGDIKVNLPFNESSVPGVFPAGDCSSMVKAASISLSSGAMVAAGIASSLGAED